MAIVRPIPTLAPTIAFHTSLAHLGLFHGREDVNKPYQPAMMITG